MSTPDLQGSTTSGLPYPESSDALNQGANAIKALAQALETKGAGVRVLRGKTLCTFDATGRANIPLTGFTTIAGAFAQHAWNADAPFVPMVVSIEVSKLTTTNIGVWCAKSTSSGSASWWTDPAYLYWEAWGT